MVMIVPQIIFGALLCLSIICPEATGARMEPNTGNHRIHYKTDVLRRSRRISYEHVPRALVSLVDASCFSKSKQRAPPVQHAYVQYAKKKTRNGKKRIFALATYKCLRNFELLHGRGKLYCSRGRWLGAKPICVDDNGVDDVQNDDAESSKEQKRNNSTCPPEFAKNCQQDCATTDGKPACVCFYGFEMINGNCQDANECFKHNAGCAQVCTNLMGSFSCSCHSGYRLQSDGKSCEDINECLLRNGHGPCEDVCENTKGSYRCLCSKKGSKLAKDKHSCDDVDECADKKAGCSHGCINTRGKAFCSCPEGLVLGDDWKTCQERALSDQPAAEEEGGDEEDYGDEENGDDYGDDEEDYNEREGEEDDISVHDYEIRYGHKNINESTAKTTEDKNTSGIIHENNNINKGTHEEQVDSNTESNDIGVITTPVDQITTHQSTTSKTIDNEENREDDRDDYEGGEGDEDNAGVLTSPVNQDTMHQSTTSKTRDNQDKDENGELDRDDYEEGEGDEDNEEDYDGEDNRDTDDYEEKVNRENALNSHGSAVTFHNVTTNPESSLHSEATHTGHGTGEETKHQEQTEEILNVLTTERHGVDALNRINNNTQEAQFTEQITNNTEKIDLISTTNANNHTEHNLIDRNFGDNLQLNNASIQYNESDKDVAKHVISLPTPALDNQRSHDANENDDQLKRVEEDDNQKRTSAPEEEDIGEEDEESEDEYDYGDENYDEDDNDISNKQEGSEDTTESPHHKHEESDAIDATRKGNQSEEHNLHKHDQENLAATLGEVDSQYNTSEQTETNRQHTTSTMDKNIEEERNSKIKPDDDEYDYDYENKIVSSTTKRYPHDHHDYDRTTAKPTTTHRNYEDADDYDEYEEENKSESITTHKNSTQHNSITTAIPATTHRSYEDEYDEYEEEIKSASTTTHRSSKQHYEDTKVVLHETTTQTSGNNGVLIQKHENEDATAKPTTIYEIKHEDTDGKFENHHETTTETSENHGVHEHTSIISHHNTTSRSSANDIYDQENTYDENKVKLNHMEEKPDTKIDHSTEISSKHPHHHTDSTETTTHYSEREDKEEDRRDADTFIHPTTRNYNETSSDNRSQTHSDEYDDYEAESKNTATDVKIKEPDVKYESDIEDYNYEDETNENDVGNINIQLNATQIHVTDKIEEGNIDKTPKEEIKQTVTTSTTSSTTAGEDLDYNLEEYNEIIRNENERQNSTTDQNKTECGTGYKLEGHNCVEDYDDDDYDQYDDRHSLPGKIGCAKGYKMEGQDCADINECEDPENGCSDYCENTVGSYKCTCAEGYEIRIGDKYTCHDVDECKMNPCSHLCLNHPGGYRCGCPENWHLNKNNRTCEEIRCSHRHEIVDSEVVCVCPPGYSLQNKTSCEDIDECSKDPCEQTCINVPGSFECSCDSGYVMIEGGRCIDKDECEEDVCPGPCENLEGSYRCICDEGYAYDEFTKICVDVDECMDAQLHDCGQICNNTQGSYECACNAGYRLIDGASCDDVNECEQEEVCDQVCINTNGSHHCGCQTGYTLNGNGISCDDVNECLSQNGNCTHFCANLKGSYECACDPGFELDVDKKTCIEVDPCTVANGGCSHNCETIAGEAFCGCPDGHELIGKTCFKTNPCKIDNGGCSHKCEYINNFVVCSCPNLHVLKNNTHCELFDPCFEENGGCSHLCQSSNGTSSCSCPDETYELINKTCFKINPCLFDNGGCSHSCTFNNYTVVCSCPKYHRLKLKQCELVNPCESNNGGCSHFCEFADEEVLCACPNNYELIGKVCELIDPCMIDNGGCSHECVSDDDGKVECFCPDSYTLRNNKTCIKQNPCLSNNGGCSHICVNHKGKPKCSCPFNYQLIEKSCVAIDPCMENNGNCSHTCNSESELVTCECPHDLKLINATNCINPCSQDNGGCSHKCEYRNNILTCGCPEGFTLDRTTCVKIDPCKVNNGGCSHLCLNVGGTAACQCPDRYELSGKTCKKSNPCAINNGGCSHTCTNHRGRPKCSCPFGFTLRGKICMNNQPCAANNGGCSHICNNNNGLRLCSCPPGYILRPNKRICKEINECLVDNGGCSHTCRNIPGSFSCQCPSGYKLSSNRKTCRIVDYCENNGGCDQICRQQDDGRTCECYEGYQLHSDGITCSRGTQKCSVENISNAVIKCLEMDTNTTDVPVGTRCYYWCDKGYKLVGEFARVCEFGARWDTVAPVCMPVACPKLVHPEFGRLIPSSCGSGKNFVGERCRIHCRRGYRPVDGIEHLTCESNLQWNPIVTEVEARNICKGDFPKPFIRCPSGGMINYNLPRGQSTMLIKIPRPDSNVDWWRYVRSNPTWGMQLGTTLPPGRSEVTFTAYSPNMNSSSSCVLVVNVKDTEPPEMSHCPGNMDIRLDRGEYTRSIQWRDPEFTDNIGIRTFYKSKESGTTFGPGVHHVNYVASDDAGNRAFCHFTITIKDADFTDNTPGKYRAVLICPHGIQYMSKTPDNYDNSITSQQGCHWSHIRVRESNPLSRYKIPSQRSYYDANRNNQNTDNSVMQQIKMRHTPFSWYQNCC